MCTAQLFSGLLRGDAVKALEHFAEVIGVGKAGELCNCLHLQLCGGEHLQSSFHALCRNVFGKGVAGLAVKERGKIAGTDLHKLCQMMQREVCRQV